MIKQSVKVLVQEKPHKISSTGTEGTEIWKDGKERKVSRLKGKFITWEVKKI